MGEGRGPPHTKGVPSPEHKKMDSHPDGWIVVASHALAILGSGALFLPPGKTRALITNR